MLDKTEYYHGAAIVRLLEDNRCFSVKKKGFLGYIVNDDAFVFLKYTTKARSPWRFTFDQEDIDRCIKMSSEHSKIILGLICGGDGACAIKWKTAKNLIDSKPGFIAVKRGHNQSYKVWGSASELAERTPVSYWPSLVFETSPEYQWSSV